MSSDEKIKAAFDRLAAGLDDRDRRPTVSDICAEAGVSRASFYRSAHAAAIRHALEGSGATGGPELEQLRVRVRQLTQADAALRSRHGGELRELRATAATYANQIQLLTLRVGQLEEDNRRLLARLESATGNVTALPVRP
ncbi:MAG: hypothetical protein M0Z42_11735 [Actinomycetota bacterium]|jgi:AcrR family transcriptional regulator|nr:hypothetical protein [Actinomycetota bacterium]